MFNEGKITWEEAVSILENASAIVFEDTVTYFDNISEDADTIQFCPEEDGDVFTFKKKHNKEILFIDSSIWLNDRDPINDSEAFQITILQPVNISTLVRNN
jgi:hypothetical protein